MPDRLGFLIWGRFMRVALFEDRRTVHLGPLVLLRPSFETLCGRMSLRERLLACCPVSQWGAFIRENLVAAYAESCPDARVNDADWLAQEPTLLINGRWLPDLADWQHLIRHAEHPHAPEACFSDNQLVALRIEGDEAALLRGVAPATDAWDRALSRIARGRKQVAVAGRVVEYPWHLVEENGRQLGHDFETIPLSDVQTKLPQHVAILGSPDDIAVDVTAHLAPFVVLDARSGPITVDAHVQINAFCQLEGPCHIGSQTQLFRAHIRAGTTIGPVCRVGGEVEASIMHGYVNKYHTGFLGHSYVCPWVNLGALTTNSDLKLDYSSVQVPLDGEPIDSGSLKVGCFIGDHTKTGLGSLFNTGSSVGVMALVLPGGELLPKHIPSFARIWHGKLTPGWNIDRCLEFARAAMQRRKCDLTAVQEQLLRDLYAEATATGPQSIPFPRGKAA